MAVRLCWIGLCVLTPSAGCDRQLGGSGIWERVRESGYGDAESLWCYGLVLHHTASTAGVVVVVVGSSGCLLCAVNQEMRGVCVW